VEGQALRWCEYSASTPVSESEWGIREPASAAPLGGPSLPPGVDAVILPALAVDAQGARLGQGGGYYDRALASVIAHQDGGPLRIALVYDDDVVDALPTETHDLRVNVIITPTRTIET